MNTRRKSKESKAIAETIEPEGATGSSNSNAHDAQTVNGGLQLDIPIDIDIDSLKPLFPDASLTTPSAETIISLYRLVLEQSANLDETSQQLDQARADVARKEVELDQALQDQDSELGQLRSSLEDVHKELEEHKAEKAELGALLLYD